MMLSKTMKLLIGAIFVIVILAAALFFVLKNDAGTTLNINRPAVIKEMRDLDRLETASFTIEKVIDGGSTQSNAISQFLFGDKILLIAHGQVVAGFDFSQISEKDIEVSGTTLKITLPKPQILTTSLDNTQTRVYDRQKGILNQGGKDLESEARVAAEKAITDAACSGNILKQAADNGRKQLTALFSSLGFTQITIVIPEASC